LKWKQPDVMHAALRLAQTSLLPVLTQNLCHWLQNCARLAPQFAAEHCARLQAVRSPLLEHVPAGQVPPLGQFELCADAVERAIAREMPIVKTRAKVFFIPDPPVQIAATGRMAQCGRIT
jgi:hypothetical protein